MNRKFERNSPSGSFAAEVLEINVKSRSLTPGHASEIIEKNNFYEEDKGKKQKEENLREGLDKREKSRVCDITIAVVKNVIIFSVLPAVYAFLFIYAQKSLDKNI